MDDFDNLGKERGAALELRPVRDRHQPAACPVSGIGGVDVPLPSKNDEEDSGLDQSCARLDDDKLSVNGVSKTPGLCFVDDWAGVRLGEFWFDPVLIFKSEHSEYSAPVKRLPPSR